MSGLNFLVMTDDAVEMLARHGREEPVRVAAQAELLRRLTNGMRRYVTHREAHDALAAAGFVYAPAVDRWLHQDGREASMRDALAGPGAVVVVYSDDPNEFVARRLAARAEQRAAARAETLTAIALEHLGPASLETRDAPALHAALEAAFEAGRKARRR
jgi:hypothetical protein